MKAMGKDWYQRNWTLDIQNMSWVEDTNRQVDFFLLGYISVRNEI